jgi:hypothetical protein
MFKNTITILTEYDSNNNILYFVCIICNKIIRVYSVQVTTELSRRNYRQAIHKILYVN